MRCASTATPAKANTELADLQAVTAADVQRVAAEVPRPDDRRMTIRYRPESERPKGEAAADAAARRRRRSTKYAGPVFALAPEGQRQAPPPLGAPVSPVLPKPAERTLANGLRVIVAALLRPAAGHRRPDRQDRRLGRSRPAWPAPPA